MTDAGAHRVTVAAGRLLVALGATVLLGWIFDVHVLKAVFWPITMKANAASGLLLAGLSLVLLDRQGAAARRAGRGCAALAGAIGAATFSQHVVGWDLGIDQLLFAEDPGAAATVSPGRMGPSTSLSLALSGTALLCLYRATPGSNTAAQIIGAVVATLALVPAVGYLYGATELYAIARYTGIAFHTSLALLTLSVGILTARPSSGPVAAVLADAPHGMMARRLLAAAIIVPLLLGYVRVEGERRGWYDASLGASLLVVVVIVLLSLTIWRTALALARTDADLRRAQQARDALLASERAARQTAERADRAKDEFIAALSHELRTPLNAILGWMYMVRQETVPEGVRGKAADAVLRNAGLLARLIEDLLDTSRITTGRLTLSSAPTDIQAVVQAAVESILPASEAQLVRVQVVCARDLPPIQADAQRLQQIVWNLLSNAIKFSPVGGQVGVGVTLEGDRVVITVQDEGEGIDPAFLPYVFGRFQQGDRGNARGGLGLGLYIAHHLTELHGGTLEAHSDGQGKGAVFTVRLPAVTAPAHAAELTAGAAASGPMLGSSARRG